MKYLCNVFHAMKIVFANEAGSVLKACGLDGREVMRIFCQDTQLNISPAYLRPGFAFGGSCLPKEVQGLPDARPRKRRADPCAAGLLSSNDAHIDRAYDMIARDGRRKVALFGLAFKPGTDDMRDSPLVTLAERLLGKGFRSGDLRRLREDQPPARQEQGVHRSRDPASRQAAPGDARAGPGRRPGHRRRPRRATARRDRRPRHRVPDHRSVGLRGIALAAEYEGICW